ncbi:MAG: hypothetical protein JWR17_3692 [Pseudomonas sp.]|jgi:hypothetical protein|nr:hypothetical protein [Pseudomonas sp.]
MSRSVCTSIFLEMPGKARCNCPVRQRPPGQRSSACSTSLTHLTVNKPMTRRGGLAEAVLLPEQGQRDTGTAQFGVNLCPVGCRTLITGDGGRWWEKTPLQFGMVRAEGQISPLAAKRLRQSSTLARLTCKLSAIWRADRPTSNLRRNTSRILRMDNLSRQLLCFDKKGQ